MMAMIPDAFNHAGHIKDEAEVVGRAISAGG
jgi:hypothetical protein